MKTKSFAVIAVLAILAMVGGLALADDGAMFRRNISKTPDQATERANIAHMTFYVPAQNSLGELIPIEYYDAEGALVYTRDYAKPLVTVYIDALPEEEHEEEEGIYEILGGAGFGAHDAHSAFSLDDGATWKRTNLSMSADLSSFNLANGHEYPGDAHNMTFAIAGDKVLVGWISKYCDGGSPAYTWVDEEENDLYPDIWGVAGSQGSVDFTLQGFPEVGEIPYSCVWAARGTLLEDPDTGLYDITWTKAERLTSGRRDANRLEMNGDGAAGFMMTWQEDPEGLRPGQGLGPGEGWSGAVVNQQTDLWYSHISIGDFEMVQISDEDEAPVSIYDYEGVTMPKVAAPMALPVRLTDNKMCKVSGSDPYCYIDFSNVDLDGNLIVPDPLPTLRPTDGSATFCAEEIEWTNPGNTTLNLCVAEDGRVLQGRVGASRPRVNVQPYDSDSDGVYDSAWVIMGAEESKALGEGTLDELDLEPEDLGKNMWYYSFDMLNPDVVLQGGMLNQPAIDPETGMFFELLEDDFGTFFYETEISRRFSHFSQPIHQMGDSGVSAALIVKQGILNQGGPADIFLRLLQVPEEDFVDCPAESPYEKCLPGDYNPYAYENMACEDAEGNSQWVYTDDTNGGSNPRYLQGLCLSNMINVSGGTIVSCDGNEGDCADQFPWDGVEEGESFPKVTEWVQTEENLDDQSWENPYDVSKGHRGFIDGDFIMMMYAWSPNWQANSVGNDHYNLYARRSFDGGATWTTTPADWAGGVYTGTTTCENWKDGISITESCTTYAAGEFEQARNLSQLIGNQVTILDPRYSPSGGIKMLPITDKLGVGGEGELPYEDDEERDRSKFFIVYETGDNTTVAEGEAVPMDLFYSRATNWGDDYDVIEYYNSGTGEATLGFDWLEHDHEDLSGEAGNTCNPGATYYYVVWNQWNEDEHENVSNSDIIFRRIMYLEDTEATATATILYVSHTEVAYDEPVEITFIGTGKDNDRLGEGEEITDFEWTSDIDGFLSDQKSFSVDVTALSLGTHNIYFRVKDNEGHWSGSATTRIRVAEEMAEFGLYFIYLPLVVNN